MACQGSNLTYIMRLAESSDERDSLLAWKVVEALSLLAIACLPFSRNAAQSLSAAAVLLWLTLKTVDKKPIFAVPRVVWVCYTVFLFLIGLSIFARPPFVPWTRSLLWYLKWSNYLGVFFMAADMFREPARRSRFLFTFLITMIAVCLNGVYQMTYGAVQAVGYSAEIPGRPFRMRGPFLSPNSFSAFLLLAVPMAFSEWFGEKHWSIKATLKAGMLVLFSVCLLLTFSRAALFALVAAIAVMLASKRAWKLLSMEGLFAFLFYFSSPVMRQNFFNSLSLKDIPIKGRLSFWKGAWGMIVEHPFRGNGIGTGPWLQGLYATVPPTLAHSHNSYLQIAAEVGIPALVLFLIPVFFLMIRSARLGNGRSVRNWAIWTGCLAFLFHSVAESLFHCTEPAVLFWMFWGLLAASKTDET